MSIKVVAFDADDTLWVNENYFREAEGEFVKLMSIYGSEEDTMKILFEIEMQNLGIYGFGIKGFMLAMTEAAGRISKGKVTSTEIDKILDLGKAMLNKPVELLDKVEEILKQVQKDYRVILATKGDLLDQQRKLEKSGLEKYFHHIEVMSDKKVKDYQKLIKHLDIRPEEFLMVGNSLKSDILPVIEIGGKAIYVPYEITWQHEQAAPQDQHNGKYVEVGKLHEVLEHI
ncbi:HAD family hydrolase [Fulvivirga sp.]|uniref:HAD family hydrolase n=1 Tax=Fulvivirga sp. TaxID=1931237 RepID=UPI0032EF03B6